VGEQVGPGRRGRSRKGAGEVRTGTDVAPAPRRSRGDDQLGPEALHRQFGFMDAAYGEAGVSDQRAPDRWTTEADRNGEIDHPFQAWSRWARKAGDADLFSTIQRRVDIGVVRPCASVWTPTTWPTIATIGSLEPGTGETGDLEAGTGAGACPM